MTGRAHMRLETKACFVLTARHTEVAIRDFDIFSPEICVFVVCQIGQHMLAIHYEKSQNYNHITPFKSQKLLNSVYPLPFGVNLPENKRPLLLWS